MKSYKGKGKNVVKTNEIRVLQKSGDEWYNVCNEKERGVYKVAMLKKDVVEYSNLLGSMSEWASEYLVSLSQTMVDGRWVWHVLLCEDKEGVKLQECHEVIGDTVEELRLNFLIRLAELRKERLDKVK